MEYNGWNLMNEIILVIKTVKHKKYGYPQAYLVDPKNKKQLQSAIRWGTDKEYVRDCNGKYTKDENNNYIMNINKPDVVTISNEGFKIKLLDSANESYQGGKLSFWNCLITNKENNIACVVGINAELLLACLLQNTFVNGSCKEEIMFARKQGNVGILTKNMKEYTEALKDTEIKKEISKGKTSKWQLGKDYKTLHLDEVYMGDLYRPFKVDYEKYWGNKNYILTYDEKPNKRVVYHIDAFENYKSLRELYDSYLKIIDENIKGLREKARKLYASDITYGVPVLNYGIRELAKFPSRQQGEYELSIDMDIKDFYTGLINYVQDKVIELHKKGYPFGTVELVECIVRADKFDENSLNEKEQYILDIIKNTENCKCKL